MDERPDRRILLIAPSFHGYERKLEMTLREMEHECLLVDERLGNGFWAKALGRVGILQRVKPIVDVHVERIAREAVDFQPHTVLIVNAETLKAREVRRLRQRLPHARFLLYMWDSSSKKNIGAELIAAVDRAYSFDPVDSQHFAGLTHLPLFHSHTTMIPPTDRDEDCRYDFSFVGTARIRRIKVLAAIETTLRAHGQSSYFYLYAPSRVQYALFRLAAKLVKYTGKLSRESLSYERYTEVIRRSRCIIDIEQSNQNGLTIRTMEAVFSGKPLVTTNSNIGLYDFAKDLAVGSVAVSDRRIDIPIYKDVHCFASYYEKYSLQTWLRTVLNEEAPQYFRGPGHPRVPPSAMRPISCDGANQRGINDE